MLSLFLSVPSSLNHRHVDPIAIGAFGAMKSGIFVSCLAGIDGPRLQTVENYGPWVMTVAASSGDRSFLVDMRLIDGQIVCGQSLNHLRGTRRLAKLITGAAAAISEVTSATL